MKVNQLKWENNGWVSISHQPLMGADLVLFFADRRLMEKEEVYNELKKCYPSAQVLGCSTAGEILGDEVYEHSAVATAFKFEKTTIEVTSAKIQETNCSFLTGQNLARSITHRNLKSVFVLSDGQLLNGSGLVKGLRESLPGGTIITGGLAGDGPDFNTTYVSCNAPSESGLVAIVGFYGDHLHVSHGSVGGWDSFGPDRVVTRSKDNILYELDSKPALDLYKMYLGDEASMLPASGLLFPLMIKRENKQMSGLVRTVLSVNEREKSMVFAGDIPEGYHAKLMMASFDQLVEGASKAAGFANTTHLYDGDAVALLISCVGRKMVLGAHTEDEVEAVRNSLGDQVKMAGFYSYGEISPDIQSNYCELHNQTMTITLIAEL